MSTDAGRSDSCVFVRRSTAADTISLALLAEANGLGYPRGTYLLAEIRGKIIAAAPLEMEGAAFGDPSRSTSDVRDLLDRWASRLRRDDVARRAEAA